MTACVLCVLYIKELFIHMRLYDYWWYFRVSEAWKEVRLSEEILGISKSGLLHPLCSYIGPELPTGWCGSWLKLVSVQAIWTSVEDEFGRVVLSKAGSSRIVKSMKSSDAYDDKLAWVGLHHCLVSPRTVNTASWTTIHFPEVNWQLTKTVRSSSYKYNPSFIISGG